MEGAAHDSGESEVRLVSGRVSLRYRPKPCQRRHYRCRRCCLAWLSSPSSLVLLSVVVVVLGVAAQIIFWLRSPRRFTWLSVCSVVVCGGRANSSVAEIVCRPSHPVSRSFRLEMCGCSRQSNRCTSSRSVQSCSSFTTGVLVDVVPPCRILNVFCAVAYRKQRALIPSHGGGVFCSPPVNAVRRPHISRPRVH